MHVIKSSPRHLTTRLLTAALNLYADRDHLVQSPGAWRKALENTGDPSEEVPKLSEHEEAEGSGGSGHTQDRTQRTRRAIASAGGFLLPPIRLLYLLPLDSLLPPFVAACSGVFAWRA